MAGAILTHAPAGFFMNWFGKLPAGTEGFEYHLLVTALAAVVVIKGSGALSLDRASSRALRRSGGRKWATSRSTKARTLGGGRPPRGSGIDREDPERDAFEAVDHRAQAAGVQVGGAP